MKFFLIISFFVFSFALFSSPVGKWINRQQNMSVEFKSNGTFIWQINQNKIQGTWKQLNQNVIQTYAGGQVSNYSFQVKGNMLGLAASNGAQLYFTKVESQNNNSPVSLKNIFGTWYSTNGQIIFKIRFNKNGTYSIVMNNQKASGTWSVNGNILVTNINNVKTQFAYGFKDGFLILAQNQNSYLFLARKKSQILNLLKKYKKGSTNNQNYSVSKNSKPLTDSQFMYLLANYDKMHPNTVYNYITRFSENQKSWIPVFKAWYSLMVYRACQGTLAYQNPQDKQMCINNRAEYQNTAQFTNDVFSYGKRQTSKLLIFYKCKYGLIDKGSCNVYMGMQKSINRMQNQTSQTIIKNMEPLPCTKHYEQGTNVYLGCW